MKVEPGQRIFQNKVYPCTVELPDLLTILPYSVVNNYWFKMPGKLIVNPSKEIQCATFEKKK
jgi:hypothetical protein